MTSIRAFTVLLSFVFISLTSVSACAQSNPGYSHTGDTLISGVRVIDGLGNAAVENQDILIIDGKISVIGHGGTLEAPDGALQIDGSGLTAMPGLIDMHVHINGSWANGTLPEEEFQPTYDDSSVQRSLSGHLYAGVTTILDVGAERPEWVIQTRDRINTGDLMGPRTFVVGAVWTQSPSGWGGDAPTHVTDLESIPEKMQWYVDNNIEIIKLYTGISPQAAQFVV